MKCIFTLWHSTGTILRSWLSTWRIIWRRFIVTTMFSVNSAPVNLQRRSWKRWKSSLLWTNRRIGRVTPLRTIFLRLQSAIALMKVKRISSQKLHNILSTNRISTLWRCISWTTSLTISTSLATSEIYALNSQKKRWWSLNNHTDNQIFMRAPFGFVNDSPKRGVSVSRAECKCCKTTSQQWYASNQSAYQANDEKPATRNQNPWWFGWVVCNAKRGATELHCLVFQESCLLHRLRRSQSVFQSSQQGKIHSEQHSSNSANVFSMRQASSSYGSLHWVHTVEKA